MATYAEFLKANGATEAEIAVLDTAVGRRAFDSQQAALSESERLKAVAETDRQNIQKWYNEQALPAFDRIEAESQTAKANEARAVALIKERSKTDSSLAEVAKNMGWDVETGKRTEVAAAAAANFDEKKYFTRDEILTIARAESKAIATMGRVIQEHERLFPGAAIVDWEGLRAKAEETKKPLEQVWMDTYNVADARAKKLAADEKVRIDGLVADQLKVKEAELISRLGNPETRPLSASNSPFTMRPTTGRDKQPWELDGGNLQSDRVQRATQKAIERGVNH